MPSRAGYSIRHWCQVICGATLLLLSLVGCQTLPVPSARFATVTSPPDVPGPTPAKRIPNAVLTDAAAGEERESALVDAAPQISVPRPAELPTAPPLPQQSEPIRSAQPPRRSVQLTAQATAQPLPPPAPEQITAPNPIPHSAQQNHFGIISERIPVTPKDAYSALPSAACDLACDLPLSGLCGTAPCPPLLVLPKGKWRCYLGPLFCHDQPEELAELAEAELQVPHSLFHPVPTAPVFASRFDYAPPQLMMAPVKEPGLLAPHRAPRTLPPLTEMGPLAPLPPSPSPTSENGPDLEVIPVPDASPLTPTPPLPRQSADQFSPSAQRLQSVLKRQ